MPFESQSAPTILSFRKIWQQALHNAMTDLINYRNQWHCVFRESDKHVFGIAGVIRIIASVDGHSWASIATFSIPGVDLRDPKLSLVPDGRLMLLCGGLFFDSNNRYQT